MIQSQKLWDLESWDPSKMLWAVRNMVHNLRRLRKHTSIFKWINMPSWHLSCIYLYWLTTVLYIIIIQRSYKTTSSFYTLLSASDWLPSDAFHFWCGLWFSKSYVMLIANNTSYELLFSCLVNEKEGFLPPGIKNTQPIRASQCVAQADIHHCLLACNHTASSLNTSVIHL